MNRFSHVSGALYRIMDGVRRAKAAHLFGHARIRAEVVDSNGQSLGECDIPFDALRSPKPTIRRITSADETRWNRAAAGAQQTVLPYPPIIVEPCGEESVRIEDVGLDFGGTP